MRTPIRISQNPVNKEINISTSENMETVEVINLLGQIVIAQTPNQINAKLPIDSLRKGKYYVRINGCSLEKIVIQ